MVDSEKNLEALWDRTKGYIDLSKITAKDKMNQREQLEIQLKQASARQKSLQNFIGSNYAEKMLEEPKIRGQILQSTKEGYIKGREKYYSDVYEGKLITYEKGKLKGKSYIQIRGKNKKGRNVIAGAFYLED